MLRRAVERAGDAGLASLERLSTRRGLLKKSVAVASAALGVGAMSKEADAIAAFYCVSNTGCKVRSTPWGSTVTTLGYGNLTSYNGGNWASPRYIGCVGVINGDQEYYWRRRYNATGYVHANLLSQYLYLAC